MELLSCITRFMYKCHHKEKWICCWVDCRIQEAKVERILIYIYIYTYECIGWLVDLFVETVLHLCSTRFQMPSWKSLATKPWTSKSCGLDLFWNVKRSKNHHSKRLTPSIHRDSWMYQEKVTTHYSMIQKLRIASLDKWDWRICASQTKDGSSNTGQLPPGSIFGLQCRLQCVRPVMYGARRGSNRFGKNVTRNECKWGMFADVGMMLA